LKGFVDGERKGARQRDAEGAILVHDIAHREDFERMAAAVFETVRNFETVAPRGTHHRAGKVLLAS
jgi:hypothetical protein